jgi:tetratricopeptide (TPR) repeat protein
MSNKTAKTLFIHSPFATEYAGLYQELLSGIASYQQLGNRLIQLGEQAHACRQFEKVKEIGQILSNLPIRRFQAIGYYFLAVAANSKGNGDQDRARKLYETVAETAPILYRAKAILSLGAVSFNAGNFDSALYYFKETLKVSGFNIASLEAIRGMAVLKAVEGAHDHAIKDLESVLPIIKHVPPYNYFDFLNSYAVELGQVGRMDEAENVSKLTIASPFAPYYPEWQSTYSEIRSRRKRRSTISISRSQSEWVEDEEIDSQPAETNLIPFPVSRSVNELMSAPVSSPETLGREITPIQLLGIILKVKLRERITDEEIDRICMAYFNAVMDIWPQK